MPSFAEVKGVKIFTAGAPQSGGVTEQDLDQIIANFPKLKALPAAKHEPPVVISHDEDQALLKADHLPAAGWPSRVWRQGKDLFADIVDMPRVVADLVNKKAFKKCSVEIYDDYHDGEGKAHGKALRRISLLGGGLPRIRGLSDWAAIYGEAAASQRLVRFAEADQPYQVYEFQESLTTVVEREDQVARLSRIWWEADDQRWEIMHSDALTPEEKKAKLEALFGEMLSLIQETTENIVASFYEQGGGTMNKDKPATGDPPVVKTYTEEEVRRMQEQAEADRKAMADRLSRIESERRHERVAAFCERLKRKGLVPVIADDAGLRAFMEQLSDETVQSFAEGKTAPRAWFETFIEDLVDKARSGKLVVDYAERTGAITPSGAEPGQDGEEILHQRARKYQEENKCTYAEAVIRVSEAAG
jgi:hypothetical protein